MEGDTARRADHSLALSSFVRGDAHARGSAFEAKPLHVPQLRLDGGRLTIQLDEQDGFRIDGKAGVLPLLDNAYGPLVHELDGGRNDACVENHGDHAAGVAYVGKHGHGRTSRLRLGNEPENDLRDHGKRALGADEQLRQVQPRYIFDHFPSGSHHATVRGDRFQAKHIVLGHTILEPVRASGAHGHVAADRALFLTGGVGRVIQTAAQHGLLQIGGHHARLDAHQHVDGIQLQNRVHLGHCQHDPAQHGDRASRQPCSGAPHHHRHVPCAGQPEHGLDLRRAARKHDKLRPVLEERAVIGVRLQILG